ncbi:MAG: hypothetical protein J0H42_04215 [Rhizobiales bacterium]|nr:hypothetical protein [Hyphomicrobiales bacterium]
MPSWPRKDPDEVLDYAIDWSARLDGDTIATSQFTLPPGIVANSSSNTTTTTTVWLSGGTDGETYLIQNRITTAGGRTMDQTMKLKIKSR